MKKTAVAVLSLLLVVSMLCPVLAGCSGGEETSAKEGQATTESSGSETTPESESKSETDSETESGASSGSVVETIETTETDTNEESTTETDTNEESTTETEELESVVGPQLEGDHAALIENADALKNGVNAYFPYPDRSHFAFENLEMSLDYALSAVEKQQVSALTNKDDKTYIQNTMDVFVKMTDGKTYYASDSGISTAANIYRFGYYFYEMRLEEQNFVGNYEIIGRKKVNHTSFSDLHHIESALASGVELNVVNEADAADPYVVFGRKFAYPADKYQYIQITMKADSKAQTTAALFIFAGEKGTFNSDQTVAFPIINDGEYHTYTVPLFACPDYTGDLKGIRIDVSGAGASYTIKEVTLLETDTVGMPIELALNRSFNVYSDKMHHIIQVAAKKDTKDIAEVGMLTELPADTVAKLIVKDKNGTHTSLEEVDWATAEYVGFDIKDAGIFGYILPYDGRGGQLTVILENGVYSIIQTKAPENNQISASATGTENRNDFFMGQRVYTDDNHTFDEFLHEAECERNPLKEAFIKINEESSTKASYAGYDSLEGYYRFDTSGPVGGFNTSYYNEPNKHYRVSFEINGDNYDRSIYVMTYTKVGSLESAVLLDGKDILLPVPIEVGKNFSEVTGDRNLFNLDDPTYGQAIFPMVIEAKSRNNEYTVLNLYQNWGNFPLKQISWIQFYAPYYHLSTGVIETNCILPWYTTKNAKSLNTLPDFRSMSAPFWKGQPQHNSCGAHHWLKYTDAEGNFVTSENTLDIIDSYGPTYADVSMDYISDDGKIKINYVHSEMPQTDENRTFYEITYEVLEDVSIKDFKSDFQFYSVTPNDPTGWYTRVGYLNENNESVVVDAMTDDITQYVLGDNCPYFSFFNMEDCTREFEKGTTGYANVAFLVYNSEFIIGGEKSDADFIITDNGKTDTVSISLNLGEVTLKAGDSFKINAILLPWGSEQSDYSGTKFAPDQNVRNVREDTLLNPLTATAEADCEVIGSVFVPKLMSTNGESAEFTLSGGNSNVAVRIYGFDKMTVPVISEWIDGEWKEYAVNSLKNPDKSGSAHAYDGYMIHYDGNGTFSYSFVVTMDNGAPRTFKIVADGNYEAWEREEKQIVELPTQYIDPNSEYKQSAKHYAGCLDALNGSAGFKKNYTFADAFVEIPLEGNAMASPKGTNAATRSGAYLVLTGWTVVESGVNKYVFSVDNGLTWQEVSLHGKTAFGSASDKLIEGAISRVTNAGQSFAFEQSRDAANANYQGSVTVNPTGILIDLSAYIGNTVNVIVAAEPAGELGTLCPLFCISNVTVCAEEAPEEVDPDVAINYAGCLDMLNGETRFKVNYANAAAEIAYNANAIASPKEIQDAATYPGAYLVLAGWTVVEGGVEKYVFSVDGGETWHQISGSFGNASAAMISGATTRMTNVGQSFTFSDPRDIAKGRYQGAAGSNPTGMVIDLSAYVGSTVNVTVAAVPAQKPETVCPIAHITGVSVAEQAAGLLVKN